jgi:thimet oligopeptidase
MKKVFIAISAVLISLTINAQKLDTKNPLLMHSNASIRFDKVTAQTIKDAVDNVIKVSDERIDNIASIKPAAQTAANTLMAMDELQYDIVDLLSKLGLVGGTYVNDSARDAANEEAGRLSSYASDLYLNEPLYKSLKQFSNNKYKTLKADQQKYLRETILAFEKNGMKLNAEQRKELQAINEKLTRLGIEFDRNIGESKDSVEFTEEQLKGVAANTKAPWKRANGKYMVYVNGPNYTEVMSNVDDEATRKTMYIHYNNRAYPKNIAVLDSLFFYRDKLAKRLGFDSYAAYSVVDKMSGSPAKVWAFENDLIAKLTPNVTKELNELKEQKKQLHPELPNQIFDWDVSFYRKKLLDTKYQLSTDEVKQYFEMNNTLKGMFTVYENLFSIKIKETKGVPTWFSKVKTFETYKDGKMIGLFYLDLFPRPNKYTHFACFPINQYRKAGGKEVVPVSALVCNFPEGTATEPSLLYHSDVVTLFHEFGHLVHSMLGRSEIASQGPFNVKGDFVEAPSQFLENWVWQYESLKLFAKHYKTGKPLPLTLFNKMKATQQVGVATQYIRQAYLGVLDFTYEGKYDSIRGKDIVKVSEDLTAMRQIPFVEGSHFITSFGHLSGYAANYYGYLWSKVFAEDMFSVFKKKGVMDKATGLRYRKEVLERAATKEEIDMLRAFLGREPNSAAFLQSLGIK